MAIVFLESIMFISCNYLSAIVLLFLFVLISFARNKLSCVYSLLCILFDLKISLKSIKKTKQYSIADLFEQKVDANPNFIQLISAENGK